MADSAAVIAAAPDDDPYRLDASGIKEPPSGWRGSLTHLGPGLVLSASIVGSGELIATTTAGAQAGFALLWLVLFSCAVKVAVQIELARWTIATGSPALSGYNRVPPRIGRIGWVNLLFFLLVHLEGAAGRRGARRHGDRVQRAHADWRRSAARAVAHHLARDPDRRHASLALYSSRYRLIERGAFWMVVIFSVVTVAIAVGLPFTPWGYSASDLASGLSFHLPPAALGAAIAMFGITGVGSDEITMYTYWCIEKGYARWVGPERRQRGLGAPGQGLDRGDVQGRAPVDGDLHLRDARVLPDGRGGAAPAGAGAARQRDDHHAGPDVHRHPRRVGDAASSWSARSRCWARRCGRRCRATRGCTRTSSRWWAASTGRTPSGACAGSAVFTVALPIVWGGSSLVLQPPVLMVQIGGVMTGIFLIAVLVATWYSARPRNRSTRLRRPAVQRHR